MMNPPIVNECIFRPLAPGELCWSLFARFQRRQVVTLCCRRQNSRWILRGDPFVDEWSQRDYAVLIACLKNTLATGGLVLGAFQAGRLKGFASVEAAPLGSRRQYRDLTSLHVSQEARGQGVGRELFTRAAAWARQQGGEALYLSAHSAVETQAFYLAMGCEDARELLACHVRAEPYDRQMEYCLF